MGYKSKFKGSTVEERLRAVPKKQDTLVSGVNIKTIVGESILGGGDLNILYKSITYQSLFDLRKGSKLKPGQFYRITDYVTTTSQANTRSAGNLFDVVVLALTNDTLAERAWACHRDGRTDFQNSHLESWQIWYCLDNDTTRFAWAVPISEGGKGVIYRMIDEFNNDVPYDFKNIQFYRKWDTDKQLWSIIPSFNDNLEGAVLCYTFSSSGSASTTSFTDMSLRASNNVYSNVIKPWVSNTKQTLNNICFFGSNCHSNTFGNNCYSNTFGDGCNSNTFRSSCYSNTFGDGCNSNTFGNNCYYNTFGNKCYSNTFGNGCYSNTFGENCGFNSFGNNCESIKFASDASAATIYDYYRCNHFGDGCQYIVFTGAGNASPFAQVQNYNFAQGLQGTENKYLSVSGLRNRPFETKVAKNSTGDLKIYCEADQAS